jgi:RimJ/RimL family protein N-acetyltransferase
MNEFLQRYPRKLQSGDSAFDIRQMTPDDEAQVLAFAAAIPSHDLLFLPRDIRQPRVMAAWVREMRAGNLLSLLASRPDTAGQAEIVGSAVVARDPLSFSPHVGELRVLLAPSVRDQGHGRVLIQESFLLAVALGLTKLTARMTGEQTAGIAVFEDMGFRVEALLRDQVRDVDGGTYDIVILSEDVAARESKHALYGISEAFD